MNTGLAGTVRDFASTGVHAKLRSVPLQLDDAAYGALLQLARRGLISFKWDPDRHPRDLNGRWRNVPDFKDGRLGSLLDRKTQGLPDNTQDLHTEKTQHGWRYTKEREKLHEAIIEAYLAGHKPHEDKAMLFTAGGAGSGKTTALEVLDDIEPEDAVLIDPDDIKPLIPEYEKLLRESDPRAVTLVHDESIDIATKLLKRVTEGGYNATMDGTGASPLFVGRINAALNAGYEVKVAYFNTDVETALVRIEERKKKTGRAVNRHVAWDMHRNASRIFHDVYELGVAMDMYDTTGKVPVHFMHAEAGSDSEILDQQLFDAFLKKGEVRSSYEIETAKRPKTSPNSSGSSKPGFGQWGSKKPPTQKKVTSLPKTKAQLKLQGT